MTSKAPPKKLLDYDHLLTQGGRAIFRAVRESQGFDGQSGRPKYDPNDWNTELAEWEREDYRHQTAAVLDTLEEYGVIRFSKTKAKE